jgi:hypothetical protein
VLRLLRHSAAAPTTVTGCSVAFRDGCVALHVKSCNLKTLIQIKGSLTNDMLELLNGIGSKAGSSAVAQVVTAAIDAEPAPVGRHGACSSQPDPTVAPLESHPGCTHSQWWGFLLLLRVT